MASKSEPNSVDEIWLSTRVRVKHYRDMESKEDRAAISKFVYERFMERYVNPLRAVEKGEENGFLIMASCCLLIEGLTAFREGWCTTEGLSERAFHLFFGQENLFRDFRGYEQSFWKGVRCGILHQGETVNGWKLNFSRPSDDLFVQVELTVNCFKFLDQMVTVLEAYRKQLSETPWKYELWRNFRCKMAATIEDCKP